MQYSKVGICNLALAALGEKAIRDFSEGNTRARMCDKFYEVTRDYLLGQFFWPFARVRKKLQELADPENWYPDGTRVFGIPSDCSKPIDVWPEGSFTTWEVLGDELALKKEGDVVLVYIKKELNPGKYSAQFVNLLSLALAVRMCMPLTQDETLSKTLLSQYMAEQNSAWSTDAAVGNKHLHNDNNPAYDAFVDPDYSFTEDR